MIIKKFKYLYLIKSILIILGLIGLLYNYIFNTKQNKDIINSNIVFILDISNSMNTQDVKGKNYLNMSRLELSKEFIRNEIEKNKNSKFGLILFSNNSNYYIPSTKDVGNFNIYLDQVNSNIMPNPNSNLTNGLDNFIKNSEKGSIGVLISDLGNDKDYQQSKEKLKTIGRQISSSNLSLIVVGVGSSKGSYVKNKDAEYIYNNGSKILDKRNDIVGELLAKNSNVSYIFLENHKQIDTIELNKGFSINNGAFNEDIIEMLSYISILLGL